jgi:hypothetical protein
LSLIALSSAGSSPTSLLLLQVLLNLLNVTLVRINDLAHIAQIFLDLLDLRIILLDAVEQSLTCLREGQIHLVCLQLKVFLAFHEGAFLLFEVLSTLLKGILLEATLGLDQAAVDFLKVCAVAVDICCETTVFLLELFIFIALLGI